MSRLSGSSAIVTGAAQGLGATYARALAAEGAMVTISDILDPTKIVNEIRESGGKAVGIVGDVSKLADCKAMADIAIKNFGRIDILVNNAAIFAVLERRSFDQISEKEWDNVMAVNTRGPFLCAQAVFPQMKKQSSGKIVNIASATVYLGTPGMLHYVASKGAVVAFTRALARELGQYGIHVNGLAPGLTMSEQLQTRRDSIQTYTNIAVAARTFKREQLPQDLIGALLYLASPASDFMTGQTIIVDGGLVMQ